MQNLKISSLFLFIFIFVSCSDNNFDKEKTAKQIHTILDNWHSDAKNTNFDAYFNTISNTGIYIGTDASENWTKKQFKTFSKPYFDNGKAWNFLAIKRNIYFSENKKIAWFDELLDTWMGTCRGSGVLENGKEGWQIKHYVLSVTIPNDEMEKVIAIKKKQEQDRFAEREKT